MSLRVESRVRSLKRLILRLDSFCYSMILNTLEEPIEIDAFDYLYVFLCVIFLGSATVFTQGSLENFGLSVNGGVESVIGKLLMFLLSVCLLTKYGFHPSQCFNRKITLIIIVWGILFRI